MAKLLPNQFTTYEFETEVEQLTSAILTEPNVQAIQNQLARAAMERANLDYDVNNPHAIIQQEAALKGEMNAYTFLLDAHKAALEVLSANPIEPASDNPV